MKQNMLNIQGKTELHLNNNQSDIDYLFIDALIRFL